MNKRIEELAKQAGFYADKYGHCKSHLGDAPSDADDIVDLKKFAELIVKECADEALNFWCDQYNCNESSARHHILKHFGVEQ